MPRQGAATLSASWHRCSPPTTSQAVRRTLVRHLLSAPPATPILHGIQYTLFGVRFSAQSSRAHQLPAQRMIGTMTCVHAACSSAAPTPLSLSACPGHCTNYCLQGTTPLARYAAGKMAVLEALLAGVLDSGGGERCVVVSSFTRTLDVVAALCARNGWSTARVAGDTCASKRQDVVTAFNSYGVGQVGGLCCSRCPSAATHAMAPPTPIMHAAVRLGVLVCSTHEHTMRKEDLYCMTP